MKSKIKFLLAAIMLLAGTTNARAQSTSQVTDVMNREWTGRSGSSYGDWSGLALTSDAVYAGNSAGGNSAIQLRSNNQNSGIVTTTSGGTVASVTVTWNSNTPSGRTLEVYGKHSAYSSASDLYGDNAGDLLGSIVYGTSTPLTIEGDYEYIGLRSMSGAMYLNEIQVVWNVAGSATPEPEPTTETLLTTITATAQEQANYSTANVATVSFSYTAEGSSAYFANWGWYGYGWSATVNAAEGYTITKCIFYDDANRTATDSEAPFVVETTEADKTPKVNGTPILANTSKGIKKIEVYGYVTPAVPQVRTLTGVPQGWTVQAGDPLTGVDSNADGSYSIAAGQPVVLVPSAEDKPRVKSVTLVDNSTPPAVYLEASTTAWLDGVNYAVPAGGLTYSNAVTVSGNVTLTLTEGTTLTLNKGISLAEGATLTVEGNGTMNVNGTNGADNNSNEEAASGGSGTAAISGSGTLVLTSGTVTAIGGNGGNVSDYMPECKGGHGAAAISCTLTVNGGTLTATGGNGGSLTNGFGPMGVAGDGGAGVSGALTVNGGTLTATGGNGGAKSSGPETRAGSNGRGVSSTWTAGTGITFSDSADGTSWTANTGTSSTQRYVKAE